MEFLDFTHELQYTGIVAGLDEAGRGPLAGPVVAAAVILDRNNPLSGIHDSKKLTRQKREILYDLIMAQAIVGVGIASVDEIDEYNILGATKRAMRRAYDTLANKPDIALVDGNQLPDLPCTMKAVVGGDALCISIAAASIIAKVTRDRIMTELAVEFPYYGWDTNVGYGTRLHQEGMDKFGITPHHRRSFSPVQEVVKQLELSFIVEEETL